MMRLSGWMSLVILAAVPAVALAQGKQRDVHLIFKDGYAIKGKVNEAVREFVYDPASGRSFSIPSGDFSIDDHVRNIIFSPGHVQKVIQLKTGDIKEPMRIKRFDLIGQNYEIHSSWVYTGFSKWGDTCERSVQMSNPKGPLPPLKQKIGILTPHFVYAVTEGYKWDLRYATQEFSPELIKAMLEQVFREKKDLKDVKPGEKFLQIAAFFQEAGWFKEAETELDNITQNFPEQKKFAEEALTKLRKQRADLFVESIDKAKKVGQHGEAIERLERHFANDSHKIVSPKYKDLASDLKVDYDRDKVRVDQATKFLKDFPAYTNKKAKAWTAATAFILDELNYDTIDRLTEFVKSASQHETQRQEKVAPTQTAEQVLAIAVTSWLQGKQAFDTDPKVAFQLVAAREFLLEYLRCDDIPKRTNLLAAFNKQNATPKLETDVLTRLIRMMPPPEAHPAAEIDTKIQTLKAPGGATYLVQLPPNYHHQRSYPVLFVLHSTRDSAEESLKRCSEDAAKQGFILVAPLWAGNKAFRAKYQYSDKEHMVFLDTLRDVRRRFQIDSDRVFLFGWEEGAKMAFDVGLEHPDLFAGVVPMNGTVTPFMQRFYWPNAQYLPFYIIEGERNGGNAKAMRDLLKKCWTREPFVSMYIEYKGRLSEWFAGEIPLMFDWMSRKKRHMPMKELGHLRNGEEFRSSRNNENRFYWLSYVAIADRHHYEVNEPKWAMKYQPAMFQANLSFGNVLNKGLAKEKIWTRLTLNVTGARQLCFWITPDMMDLSKKVEVYLNGQPVGGMRDVVPSLETLLEALHQSGDRQRLFVAKIDIR